MSEMLKFLKTNCSVASQSIVALVGSEVLSTSLQSMLPIPNTIKECQFLFFVLYAVHPTIANLEMLDQKIPVNYY